MEPEPTPPPKQSELSSTNQPSSESKNSDPFEGLFSTGLPQEVKNSTYLREVRKGDIRMRDVYVLESNIIAGTTITENMRARIRSFLMSQASKQWVMRETLVMACTYVDLFFKHQGFCAVEDFQSLAISALILAMKNQEGKFPTVSFNVFGKEQLLNWERKLAKRLQYNLFPPTYVTFVEQILVRWRDFTEASHYYASLVSDMPPGPNLRLRALYEQLDCIFMVLKSLSWPLQTLVINLFFLHVRNLNVPHLLTPAQLAPKEFIAINYAPDEFKKFFECFLREFEDENKWKLEPELGGYLKHFLVLKTSIKEFPIKKNLDGLRIWDKLQTFPKQCYTLYKSIIEILK